MRKSRRGDRLLFHGESAEIEFIVDSLVGDPAIDWYMREHGPGVMVLEPKYLGRVYLGDTANAEDLVFIGRKESA